MQRGQQRSVDAQFFSQQNEGRLYTILVQDIQQKQGAALTAKQQERLTKALDHYMHEVWDTNGPMPVQQLNREALTATAKDFTSYLRRTSVTPSLGASERIVGDVVNQPRTTMASQQLAIQQGLPMQARPSFESNLLMDTGSRYEQLQQERIAPASARPSVPDFQISLTASSDEPSAISLFETAKKAREAESARTKAVVGPSESDANPLVRFMSQPSILNDPQNNPTLAQPIAAIVPTPKPVLPQDYLIKQEPVINYRDTEYNLFLYSADRDWYNNTKENRYNFTVNFDVGNNKQGFSVSPSSTKKFKNITRIELVKAIVPTEGIENLIVYGSSSFNSSTRINILTYPYIVVRIPELDGNNYGTDNNLDNAFGVLQYDANWISDAANLTDGFLAMIPKFMKCQKVYQPTPLATLTKLTIQLQRPDGSSISSVSDTLSISNIRFSTNVNTTNYATTDYIFLKTSSYFSQWAFTEGNRIQIQGISTTNAVGSTAAFTSMVEYLQQAGGIQLVAVGFTTDSGSTDPYTITDGPNAVGYANVLVFRNPHADPTTGSTDVSPYGGQTNNTTLAASLKAETFTLAKCINLTHQTNLVLRIITRELDPAARVRPDNL